MSEIAQKLEKSIENLKDKSAKIYFFVQDTKGNAKASIKYIYDMALTLKNKGYNSVILHEKPDYFGVQDWLGSEYMEKLPHFSVEGQNLQVSPEEIIVVPEIFGYIMTQISNLPCAKIVLCQAYDYIYETLQPGQTWPQLGFTKCITTSDKMSEYISQNMRGVSVDVVEPYISESFKPSKYPSKPVIAIHTRDQRDSINLIKQFYVKFPQYRWISFRDMRGVSQNEFANILRDCMVSVWVDDPSSFGTFPIESMKSGVPVISTIPNLVPAWLNENNGIWIQDKINLPNVIADFLQNWLEDNISQKIYESGIETATKFSDKESFERKIEMIFESYFMIRIENFNNELNKLQVEEKA